MRMLYRLLLFLCVVQNCFIQADASGGLTKKATWESGTWSNMVNNNKKTKLQFGGEVIEQINQYVGLSAAEAAAIAYNGVKLNSEISDLKNLPTVFSMITKAAIKSKTYYNSSVFTSSWLGDFATLLNNGIPPYQGMYSFNSGNLQEVDRNYVKVHLESALQSLNQNTHSYVDTTNFATSINFTPGSFNGVIITDIDNDTQETFGIFQQGSQIGVLQPGHNKVALYGAAHEQGDILFIPTDQQKGRWRISFKKGSDIVDIANSTLPTSQQYSTSYSPIDTNAEFVCVQITGNDFPKSIGTQTKQMLSRTQCINTSQLTSPVLLSLTVVDNLEVINQGKVSSIDQTTVPLFYPAIKTMTLLDRFVFPFLFLPESLQKNGFISGWISFINSIMGVLSTNFNVFLTPSLIQGYVLERFSQVYIIKAVNNFFSKVSQVKTMKAAKGDYVSEKALGLVKVSSPIQTVISGLPGTYFAFTPDIADEKLLELYLELNSTGDNTKDKQVVVDMTTPLSVSGLLNNKNITILWNQLFNKYGIKVVAHVVQNKVGLSLTGSASHAQALEKELQSGSLTSVLLTKSKKTMLTVPLGSDLEQALEFNSQDVMLAIQALGKEGSVSHVFYPTDIWNSVVDKYKLKADKDTNVSSIVAAYSIDSPVNSVLVHDVVLSPLLFNMLTQQSTVKLDIEKNKTLDFDSLAVLQNLAYQTKQTLLQSGKVIPLQVGNIVINIGQTIKELSFNPMFLDGSEAELSFHEGAPDKLVQINSLLQTGVSISVNFSLEVNQTTKSYDAVVVFNQNTYDGKTKKYTQKPLFNYTFMNIKNAKSTVKGGKKVQKKPIAISTHQIGLNFTYKASDMEKPSIYSKTSTDFTIVPARTYVEPGTSAQVKTHHDVQVQKYVGRY